MGYLFGKRGSGSVTDCLLVHLSHKSWDNWGALLPEERLGVCGKIYCGAKKARSNLTPILG
jgi:hypothetical protein